MSASPSRDHDEGFTLVELLVAMTLIVVVMAGFYFMFLAFSGASANIGVSTQLQENTRNVVRVLEADVRSADPLLLVPSTFTSDPHGTSNVGANGTAPTDIIAMSLVNDRFSPCRGTTTTPPVASPFAVQPVAANLVWAFDPVAHTLTRYSWCSGGWTAGMSLSNVVDAGATMFQVVQDTGQDVSPTSTLPQQTTPSPTTIQNQSTPVCGASLTVSVTVKPARQGSSFTVRVSLPLENQTFVLAQEAC